MNIGCVIYTKNFETGQLRATWNFKYKNNISEGSGIAEGSINNFYDGQYRIIYYNNLMEKLNEYDLIITKSAEYYILDWFQNNIKKYTGIGKLNGEDLIAGWTKIE